MPLLRNLVLEGHDEFRQEPGGLCYFAMNRRHVTPLARLFFACLGGLPFGECAFMAPAANVTAII